MLSQNVAKSTVPSYYMIRTNLPHRKPQNQWQGVFYFSGITKRQQKRILLNHKHSMNSEISNFQSSCLATIQALESWKAQCADSSKSQPAIASPLDAVRLICKLNAHGLIHHSAPLVDELHASRCLSPAEYAAIIRSLAADRVGLNVLRTSAQHDPSLTYKLLGDRQGSDRAAEAYRIFDMAHTSLNAVGKKGVSAAHYNALMKVLITCGFENVTRVASTLYDELGSRQIAPTAATYELVMQSLALQGNTTEAESVLSFLRNNHADEITVGMMNQLIMGHRENKMFDRCDIVWNELVDRRWPRANVLSAELYLRSIVDHSYTRATSAMEKNGLIHVVEKKKVPLVLTQMEALGIPRVHLSPPLQDEVEDSIRKFAIHKDRFYEWGRAVKQFDFIEFRRKQGWLYGIHEMATPTTSVANLRDPKDSEAAMAPALAAELPAHFNEKASWMLAPLEHALFSGGRKERMDDVRSGDIYYDDKQSVHQRSVTWLNEVPETRYDQLYGMNNPDIPKIGIRRHLESEYTNKKEILEKDASIVKKSLSGARRVRQKVEAARTHRNSAF